MKENISKTFKKITQGYQNSDLKKISEAYHSDNMFFNASKEQLELVFENYTLETEFDNLEILQKGEIVVVRIEQHTNKLKGPEFNNNIVDAVMVLKLEDEEYKISSVAPVYTKFI